MKKILEMKNVSMTYKSDTGLVEALDKINVRIDEGEFVCVIGPSGCGKSTLLKLIAGFEEPSTGEVYFEGNIISGIDSTRGVVFQKDNLFEWFTVRNNINYGLRMRGDISRDAIKYKTDEMLELMRLKDFSEKHVYELSGGMRQRVSIGRTLINDPRILLMDEPFSALDALTREQLQDALRDLWIATKKTVFFITHDIDEALVLGTRILLLSNRPGRVIRDSKYNYTYKIAEDSNSRQGLSGDYFKTRRELYDLLMES